MAEVGFRQAQKMPSVLRDKNIVFACICKFATKNVVFARLSSESGRKDALFRSTLDSFV